MTTPDLFDFAAKHARTDGHATEHASAAKAKLKAGSTKSGILRALRHWPDGITPDEFCDLTHGLINTVRRRFTDLWKEGMIRHHPAGVTRRNGAGNEAVVWVIGNDPDRKPSRVEELKAEIVRLTIRVRELELEKAAHPWSAHLTARDCLGFFEVDYPYET